MEKDMSFAHVEHAPSPARTDSNEPVKTVAEKELEVANVDYAEAVKGLTPWLPGYLKLYCALALIALASTMNGYDGSLMGSINALPAYTNYYGLSKSGSASTGIVFAIFNVGQMVGALFVWIADWQGRKLGIFVGCVGVCVGAVVTATSPTLGGFIGGRFLLAFFSSIATTAAPLILIEIAPPQYRATVSGIYNTLYYLGSILASCTVYGTFRSTALAGTLASWRIPLWVQLICPGLVAVGVYFVPESPRWLIAKGRVEEARAFIINYHANGDPNHPIVRLQMAEMEHAIATEGMASWNTIFDLRDMFKSRNRRYRMMLNVAFSWFGQFSGNNVVSYYLPLLVENVGITDTGTKLILNIIYAVTGWIFATMGAFLHDRVGRRKMFLCATAGMAVCLAITAGTAAGFVNTGSKTSSSASIAFIYIFGCVFAIGFTAMQPVYPGEVMTNDMRAKGMAIFQLTAGTAGFVNTFAAPIALANIGYWFYVFFVFWDVFEFAFIYFFFVETKGRTLEELHEVFEAENPRKASTATRVVRQRIVVDRKGNEREVVEVV
ncbi:hypothetical protein B0A49_02019 [Cryomyces minteri]|uniref:Major facilitator superfamily (MFS) profile domain-containing protein n=1 Tax=Cryomyces minteri TaxID=331657 RepID=A0A4U0XJ25_9PEZI|nr:hypothetical protein B0A49_02019 [Cryomyces minteri]